MYFSFISDILYFMVIDSYTKEYFMQTNRLLTEPVSKIFFRYLFPAIMANMVTSIYILADTIIIGKGIGAEAMAALNIILPLFNIFFGSILHSLIRLTFFFKKNFLFLFNQNPCCNLNLFPHLVHRGDGR